MALKKPIYATREEEERINVSFIPKSDIAHKNFCVIRQGKLTNEFSRVRIVDGKNISLNKISGTGIVDSGEIQLNIKDYENLRGLRISTQQLLDAIMIEFTKNGGRSPTVILSISEYMESRGLKNRKKVIKQAREDIDMLVSTGISWEDKKTGHTIVSIGDIGNVGNDNVSVGNSGYITFTFSPAFYNIIKNYSVMNYPLRLLSINSKTNPNSYALLRKISELKKMNRNKSNEDIISIQTLLKCAKYIPTYDEVIRSNGAVTKRIIDVFERDLDALNDTLTWNYCKKNKELLTDDELQNMGYDMFSKLLINIKWADYPCQTERGKRKSKTKNK